MYNSELYNLLKNHFDGVITKQQSQFLEELITKADLKTLEDTICQVLKDSEEKIDAIDVNFNRIKFEDVKRQIESKKDIENQRFFSKKNYSIMRYAASIVAIFIASFFIIQFFQKKEGITSVHTISDINPAQSLANISLGNGDVLIVDSTTTGLIYQENGISVYRSEEGVLEYKIDSANSNMLENITITTPKGGFTKLTLSDGTIASLNSASTITYPVSFGKNNRDISAEGEIYFDIAKDKSKPFRIFSEKQTIEVLGTSFNLMSNKDEAKTTLIEGAVRIIVDNKSYFLKPGQQSIVNNAVEIKNTKVDEELAWTNDQFLFDNGSFFEVLREIENWYNVKFVFVRKDVENMHLSGSLSRKVKLSELLKVLSLNTGYKYEIQERRVLVK
ncbi:FecR family protein [Sphingobacterium bovistauri]|uniref:FecR family protein n=1 Tax=Sphingobacterium bovistauri TaxID=2781959 RepID=A0ABS7Z2B3_9SPHI|nr:FecR family protein [Sphingobacterium bovistauri]MCA5004297.1 FecR family protein [Sphingobacterium bovistauri]